MSMEVREINSFFKNSTKAEIQGVLDSLVFSERQGRVIDMYYLHGLDAGFIADSLSVSYSVVKSELKAARRKILPIVQKQSNISPK